FVRQLGGFGEQGLQLLALLTPDNLRLLDPEVVALLPASFLETLDPELRVYLDGLAVDYGGAGALAAAEAAAAAELASAAPPLSGGWVEPAPTGEPSQFQTAADLINNPFVDGAAELLNFIPDSPAVTDPRDWIGVLDLPVVQFLAENEADFAARLQPTIAELLPAESLTYLLDTYPEAYDAATAERLRGVASGDVDVFVPEAAITRTDGNPSLVLQIYKEADANTVNAFHAADDVLAAFAGTNGLDYVYVFEQASFIEDSIRGVSREGAMGAGFAVLVILLFLSGRVGGRYRLSWRATLITGLSIPSSVLFAFLLMWLIPATIGPAISDWALETGNVLFITIAKLFPASLTLNIMTLSGLTVAIGRVVDDSIVVLENSYRYIQKGYAPAEAVFRGTREVAAAIFAATVTTMAVFLPLGFVGGLISEFFLPFGLTVTYALAASYIVSITVVPALTTLLIRRENIPEERETALQRSYTPVLEWVLRHRAVTMAIATVIFVSSLFLLSRLPNSFIPSLGDPTVNVVVELPGGTGILDTNARVAEFERLLQERVVGIETILTEVGSSGGTEALFGAGTVTQNVAALTISVEEGRELDPLTNAVRREAEEFFGAENARVSAAVQAGFGGFELVVTGDDLAQIIDSAPTAVSVLENLDADGDGAPDVVNVSSNAEAAMDGSTIIRIDGRPAVRLEGDLQTADTIGVTAAATDAIAAALPPGLVVTEGFQSQQQTEGFTAMASAIGVSILLVYLVMALAFRSPIHPFTILFSLPFALVGASVALFITNSVLGISAMMGLLMLVGVVVTNGIVLLELVQQLKAQGEATYAALVEAGRTRLRPIWMTALTAILALIPLALSQEGGAIIAAELGTAVIGGLLVSTALTLIVIPVVYSLFDQAIMALLRRQYRRLQRRLGVAGEAGDAA
ncbi:MAG: efflux RND transporter permease subunit, partial [Anaerolineales bacterium]|nr:efflux RND transporter permease subunit [Anaerolineales bacterium]